MILDTPALRQEVHTMKNEHAKPVIRNYKDTLFRKLFSDKDNLLSLYNMMTGSHYTNPDLLEIVTLDNAIYMNMKNDLAFIIDCSIYLCEHQSTISPNMALRHLFYVAREYEKLINQSSLYSTKSITLPAPHFVVFYNGLETDWTARERKLSELFQPSQEVPNLELIVNEININLGVNDDLLSDCKPLFEYMQFVDKVRIHLDKMPTAYAVETAVNESLKEGILADFLLQNKMEAIQMSIFEYDEERELRIIRADEREMGREEGLKEGLEKGLEEGHKTGITESIKLLIQYDLKNNISNDIIIQKIVDIFHYQTHDVEQMVSSLCDTM